MGVEGVEPTRSRRQQIYSLPDLRSRLHTQNIKMQKCKNAKASDREWSGIAWVEARYVIQLHHKCKADAVGLEPTSYSFGDCCFTIKLHI